MTAEPLKVTPPPAAICSIPSTLESLSAWLLRASKKRKEACSRVMASVWPGLASGKSQLAWPRSSISSANSASRSEMFERSGRR
jgi:hypothetical protein